MSRKTELEARSGESVFLAMTPGSGRETAVREQTSRGGRWVSSGHLPGALLRHVDLRLPRELGWGSLREALRGGDLGSQEL